MRRAFMRTLAGIAERDPRVVLITGDLGFMVVEDFSARHPDRFFNAGVSEQNMVGMATGMAEAGFIPFVYSIATFVTLRPYEFIRNGPVLQQLPVRIVGAGGAFDYGTAGPTHHAVEDLAVMRVQPGLAVICPADPEQAAAALAATWDLPGPVYFRVGKDEQTTVPGLGGRFRLGAAEQVCDGDHLLMVATGSIAADAADAAERLGALGIEAGVMVAASLSPPPVGDLVRALARVPLVISVEGHSVTGGLGSLVAEVIAEHGLGCRLVRCGVRGDRLGGRTGSEAWLKAQHGLSADHLVSTALSSLSALREPSLSGR